MKAIVEHREFGWRHPGPGYAHGYLLGPVLDLVQQASAGRSLRIADLGCGNGYVTARLAALGHRVVGIDVSADGIEVARAAHPELEFHLLSVYDERLCAVIGRCDCVISLEVEHLFYPRVLLEQAHRLLEPGGTLILSTPYHGYLKNLAIALLGAWDRHHHPAVDGGHIKFFSRATLSALAREAGFADLWFLGAGRVPLFWKSMILVGQKPAG